LAPLANTNISLRDRDWNICSIQAQTINCLGQRRSFCVAHYLTNALSQLGVPASLIDNVGGLGPEALAQAGPGDALIAVSFSPYAPLTVDLANVRFVSRATSDRSVRCRRHSAWL
jgi:hypothetical protein